MCEGSRSHSGKLREFSLPVFLLSFLSPPCFLCEVKWLLFWRNTPLGQPVLELRLRGVTFTPHGCDHFWCWILRFQNVNLSLDINCLARWMLLKILGTFLPSEISSSWKPQALTSWSCVHCPHHCPACSSIRAWRVGLDQDSWSPSHRDGTKSTPWQSHEDTLLNLCLLVSGMKVFLSVLVNLYCQLHTIYGHVGRGNLNLVNYLDQICLWGTCLWTI